MGGCRSGAGVATLYLAAAVRDNWGGKVLAVEPDANRRRRAAANAREAGLEPAIIDVDAFAIHNAFELNYPEAMNGVVGLVNIGHEVTNVNILDDGVPVLTRDLSVGTRRFREDLQREKGMSAEDSERVVTGAAQSGDLAGYVEARGEEVAVGVERAAAFLATASRSAGGLSRVFTSGGGARIPGFNDALAQRLKVPVEPAMDMPTP